MASEIAFPLEPVDAHLARYCDGAAARSEAVRVELTAKGCSFLPQSSGNAELWSYRSLTAVPAIGPASSGVLLRHADDPNTTLFIDSAVFAAQLRHRAPHLSARTERTRVLKPALILVAMLALLALPIWVFGLHPSRGIARIVPSAQWTQLGGLLVRDVSDTHKGCGTPAGDAALRKLTARLTQASGQHRHIEVHVVDWDLVNAFALPGGHLMLTKGLITGARSADEVAGVLAHELGHALELHPEAGIVRALGTATAVSLVFANASDFVRTLTTTMLQLSYSRQAEQEADDQALKILKAARISSMPLANFFERVDAAARAAKAAKETKKGPASQSSLAAKVDEWIEWIFDNRLISTHPAPLDRARTAATNSDYPTESALDPHDWQALKQICTQH